MLRGEGWEGRGINKSLACVSVAVGKGVTHLCLLHSTAQHTTHIPFLPSPSPRIAPPSLDLVVFLNEAKQENRLIRAQTRSDTHRDTEMSAKRSTNVFGSHTDVSTCTVHEAHRHTHTHASTHEPHADTGEYALAQEAGSLADKKKKTGSAMTRARTHARSEESSPLTEENRRHTECYTRT